MNKTEYLIRCLSRTKRKDWENYVVNAVWNRLNDRNIRPVSQQYINNNGKRYLIDLYFPQVNIGVECDEWFHSRQDKHDRQREIEISDYLNQISDKSNYHPIHIRNYEGDLEDQINDCVQRILAFVERCRLNGEFEEWDDSLALTADKYFSDKSEIHVSDDFGFMTIAETCNILFATNYGGMQRSFFTPSTLKEKFGGDFVLWFPKLAIEGKSVSRGWNNQLAKDGLVIYEFNENWSTPTPDESFQRVTFAQVKDPITRHRKYRFIGVFKFSCRENGRNIFMRQSDSFPIF